MLYNSDLSCGHRLYGALDVDLTRVKLHEPLELIVQQPLLFVRDMVPRSCFLALTKLDQVNIVLCFNKWWHFIVSYACAESRKFLIF